jgi:hypothetical protein
MAELSSNLNNFPVEIQPWLGLKQILPLDGDLPVAQSLREKICAFMWDHITPALRESLANIEITRDQMRIIKIIVHSAKSEDALASDICRCIMGFNLAGGVGLNAEPQDRAPFVSYVDGKLLVCVPQLESLADTNLVRTSLISLYRTDSARVIERPFMTIMDTPECTAMGMAIRQILSEEFSIHCDQSHIFAPKLTNYVRALRATKMLVIGELIRKNIRSALHKRIKPGLRALSGFSPEKNFRQLKYEDVYKFYGVSSDANAMRFIREMVSSLAAYYAEHANDNHRYGLLASCIIPAHHTLINFYDKITVGEKGKRKQVLVKPDSPANVQYLTNEERRELRTSSLNRPYEEYVLAMQNAPSLKEELEDDKVYPTWFRKTSSSGRDAYRIFYIVRRAARERMHAYVEKNRLSIRDYNSRLNTLTNLEKINSGLIEIRLSTKKEATQSE